MENEEFIEQNERMHNNIKNSVELSIEKKHKIINCWSKGKEIERQKTLSNLAVSFFLLYLFP